MSVIDIKHAINILIVTNGNNLVIEHVRPNRNGVSINDCGYGLTLVYAHLALDFFFKALKVIPHLIETSTLFPPLN